jgi:hypothetical protein
MARACPRVSSKRPTASRRRRAALFGVGAGSRGRRRGGPHVIHGRGSPRRRSRVSSRAQCAISTARLAAGASDRRHVSSVSAHRLAALLSRETRLIDRELVSATLSVRGLPAFARNLSLLAGVHRGKPTPALRTIVAVPVSGVHWIVSLGFLLSGARDCARTGSELLQRSCPAQIGRKPFEFAEPARDGRAPNVSKRHERVVSPRPARRRCVRRQDLVSRTLRTSSSNFDRSIGFARCLL